MKKKEVKIEPKNIHNILKIKDLRKQTKHNNLNIAFTTEKNKSQSYRNLLIITKNLKKHSITIKKYYTLLIDSIIFDHKSHMVTQFKNHLLWNENAEFLKRYYELLESLDRLPNISQYYQTYTLFAPVYFGLNNQLIIIMNHWTKKKKKYLEYIEDKEDNDNKKKKKNNNFNFKKIIKSSLILTGSSYYNNKSSKKTISLTKYDNVDSFFIRENNNETLLEKYNNKKKNNEDIMKNISLSKIMNELSSNYSIYNNNDSNSNKKNEKKNETKDFNKSKKNENKIEPNKKDKYKNLILSDKTLFSYTNLYKKRDKRIRNQKNPLKVYYCSTNNSNIKNRQSQNIEINKGKKIKEIKNKIKNRINMPINEPKSSLTKKHNMNFNNIQINLNNLTRNKSNLKDKKESLTKYAMTNTNITSYSNLTSTRVSKLKKRNDKIKKLFLRNLDIANPPNNNNFRINNTNTPSYNTIDTNKNTHNYTKNSNYNLTRLLTSKDIKINRKYLTRGNIINIKYFRSSRKISLKESNNSNNHISGKINNTQVNNDPFSYKMNKLIKDKRILSCVNSFSNNKINNKNNNSKNKEHKNIDKNKNNSNKSNNFILSKRMSKGNLLRNIVLRQFHSKKEIIHKNKDNINSPYYIISPISRKILTRNNSLSKSKKLCTGKLNKKLKDLVNIKPYKKELNKINLNFNFNINFNFDINKKRQKKLLMSNKNNLGCITQRSQIIKNHKVNRIKNSGSENIHKKK